MRPLRIAGYSALAVGTLLVLAVLAVYLTLRASLPQLDGEIAAPELKGAATIARDDLGTPTIRAAARRDVAFATGYAHGQDRFFQMDLMRRVAAGELAELLGKPLIDMDEKFRIHGFRRIAAAIVQDSAAVDRELLDAYTAGVNFALTKRRRAAVGVHGAAHRAGTVARRGLGAGRVLDVSQPERLQRRERAGARASCAKSCRRSCSIS